VYRPADAYETAHCWHQAVAANKPAVLVLTRQALPHLEAYGDKIAAGVAKGGYVLSDATGARATLVASGSEVDLALKSQAALAEAGIAVRVVSVPCRDRWETLPRAEREAMLTGPVIALEAGVTSGWRGYADEVIGIDRFGESAPGDTVYAHLGMTVDRVAATVKDHLG
jgi:transketolase